MKSIIKLLTLTIFLTQFYFSSVLGGNEGGHGGGPYAFEFAALGEKIWQHLSKPEYRELLEKTNVNMEKFKNAVDETRVYSKDKEEVYVERLKNGRTIREEVDAVNFENGGPIYLNKQRWRVALLNEKLRTILHEYFGIMNVERDVFNVSIHFADALAVLYQQLLKDSRSPAQFYGVCVGSPPLAYVGPACNMNQPAIRAAAECAQREALARCNAERGATCEIRATIEKSIRSKNVSALEFCELLAIAK